MPFVASIPTKPSIVYPEFEVDIVSVDAEGEYTLITIEEPSVEGIEVPVDDNGHYVITDELHNWIDAVLGMWGFAHYSSDEVRRHAQYIEMDLTAI